MVSDVPAIVHVNFSDLQTYFQHGAACVTNLLKMKIETKFGTQSYALNKNDLASCMKNYINVTGLLENLSKEAISMNWRQVLRLIEEKTKFAHNGIH